MKSYERLKDMLCEELEKIAKKGELSAGSLDLAHKLTSTIKNIDKIEMYEEFDEEGGASYEGGSSYRRGRGRNARRDSMGRYSREGGYSEDGYSEEGGSYRRGGSSYERGGRGRSSYDGGYSRDGAKDYMIDKIEEMMEEADPKSKEALKRCIKQIENAWWINHIPNTNKL